MTHQALFGLTACGVGFSAVFALFAEMLGARWAQRWGSTLLLAGAGTVSLVGGWLLQPKTVFGAFGVGGASSTVAGLVLLLAALVLAGRGGCGDTALMVMAAGGAALAGSARDLVSLLVCLEIAAASGYAMVARARTSRSVEAAMKYFVQGAVATGLLVLGLAVFIGAFAPDGRLASIASAIAGQPSLAKASAFAFIALLAGLAFKAGAAPFHSWAPDAYETAPAPSAALLAGAVKLGMIAALASVSSSMWIAGGTQQEPLGILGGTTAYALGGLAFASIVAGSLLALRTSSYRRMLGYAGVAQVGYALIALAAFSASSALILGVTYAVATTGAFLAAEAISIARPEWDGSIEGLAGLGAGERGLSAALTLLMMSLAGLPPLLGFWGKFQVFGSVLKAASVMLSGGASALGAWYVALAVVGIAGSVVALGYYGGVVRSLYFGEPANEVDGPRRDSSAEAANKAPRRVVIALGLLALALGLAPLLLGVSAALEGFVLNT